MNPACRTAMLVAAVTWGATRATAQNLPPVILDGGVDADTLHMISTEADPIMVCIEAVDPDGDALDVTAILNTPLNGSVSGVGDGDTCFSYSPDPGFLGSETIIAVVCDGSGGCDTAWVIIQVVPNAAPQAVDDAAGTVEDVPAGIAVLVNDSDPNGDPIIITSASASLGGIIIGSDGTITYTPPPGFCGSDTINYTICDDEGLCASAIVVVTVDCVNEQPTAVDDAATTPAGIPIIIAVLVNDIEPDGDALVITGASAAHGTWTILPDGTISYTPDPGYCGADTIIYTVCDPAGLCDEGAVFVEVICPNAPPLAVDDAATTTVDTPVIVDVLANDADPEGEGLLVASASALNGTATINPDSTITYTPDPGFCGTDTLTYTVCDQVGSCATAIAVIIVECPPVNNPPVAVDDVAGTTMNTSVGINAWVNDSDPDGDPIFITSASAAHGTVVVQDDMTFIYTPDPLFCGTDTITYTICDQEPLCDEAIVVVTVECPPDNEPPVAQDDGAIVDPSSDIVAPIDVLANDTDPDGDTLTVPSADAANGTVEILSGGYLVYTPANGFCGVDTITYLACDPGALCDAAIVLVEVLCPEPLELVIPEGFSPNNDGIGDTWTIKGMEAYPSAKVTVINRWGGVVFDAAPYRNDWDGRSSNALAWDGVLPTGTYWYILDLGVAEEGTRTGYIFIHR